MSRPAPWYAGVLEKKLSQRSGAKAPAVKDCDEVAATLGVSKPSKLVERNNLILTLGKRQRVVQIGDKDVEDAVADAFVDTIKSFFGSNDKRARDFLDSGTGVPANTGCLPGVQQSGLLMVPATENPGFRSKQWARTEANRVLVLQLLLQAPFTELVRTTVIPNATKLLLDTFHRSGLGLTSPALIMNMDILQG